MNSVRISLLQKVALSSVQAPLFMTERETKQKYLLGEHIGVWCEFAACSVRLVPHVPLTLHQ